MIRAIGIGVPCGQPQPCSGFVFSFRCKKDGFTWGGNFGRRELAEAKKRDLFDRRKAEFDAHGWDASLYDVEIVEIPSEEPDAIQAADGEWRWTGNFDDAGHKLYRVKLAGIAN